MAKMNIEASAGHLEEVQDFLTEEMNKAEISEDTIFKVNLAAEEAFINIAEYAYGTENGMAEVSVEISSSKKVTVTFRDQGKAFNPLEVSEPGRERFEDENLIGGFGIFMIRKMMDSVAYQYSEGKNILSMECSD